MRMEPRAPQTTPTAHLYREDEARNTSNDTDLLWDTVVTRLSGEIGIKSRPVRSRLERAVAVHVRRGLERRGIPFDAILRGPGRVYVKLRYDIAASYALGRVFGVSSFSPARATTSDLEDITAVSLRVAQSALAKGSSFAVSCRRTGKHDYSSGDVQAKVGKAVLTGLKEMAPRVDLSKPDVTLGIEVVDERAYVFTRTLPGASGMPYGSQGKMIAILDGSVRPLVASWLMMRRGSPIVPLFVSLTPDLTRPPREVLRQLPTLADWSPFPTARCYVAWREGPLEAWGEGGPAVQRAATRALIYADALSELEDAEGIVLDERLGLESPGLDAEAQPIRTYRCSHPVYMPLMALDESEVRHLAEKIGLDIVEGAAR